MFSNLNGSRVRVKTWPSAGHEVWNSVSWWWRPVPVKTWAFGGIPGFSQCADKSPTLRLDSNIISDFNPILWQIIFLPVHKRQQWCQKLQANLSVYSLWRRTIKRAGDQRSSPTSSGMRKTHDSVSLFLQLVLDENPPSVRLHKSKLSSKGSSGEPRNICGRE